MEQRKAFIDEYLKHQHSVSELCRRFEVSRKTAYKWIGRFLAGCELVDRSRRPHNSPKATAAAVEDFIVSARKQRPTWGPKKLRAALLKAHPGAELPSVSTFALIIRRNGMVVPRRRRRRTPPSTNPLASATEPNALWCIDFKGDFLVGRRRCYPLTVMDAYSRFLLGCVALPNTRSTGVRRALLSLFETYGLPNAIRSDNGAPFASKAPAGLSELSAWWLKLGIRHERIEPGKPQQNGRHERMHLTLKLESATPPASSRKAQQRAFDRFRREYNEERPHEALGQRTPSEFYGRSKRVLPEPYWGRDFDYPEEYERARVRKSGHLPWNDRSAFVSSVLKHELLGLSFQRHGCWRVYFRDLPIGTISGNRSKLTFSPLEVSPVSPQTMSPMSSAVRVKVVVARVMLRPHGPGVRD